MNRGVNYLQYGLLLVACFCGVNVEAGELASTNYRARSVTVVGAGGNGAAANAVARMTLGEALTRYTTGLAASGNLGFWPTIIATTAFPADADGDGLSDAQEALLGTSPNNEDTDGDGVLDGQEVALNLDPLSEDTDEDGLNDGDEIAQGSDPADGNDYPYTIDEFLSYSFDNSFQADQVGAPPIVAVDPVGGGGFEIANVFGEERTVYRFGGNASPPSSQGGLQFDGSNRLSTENYSIQMVFEFDGGDGTFRRIIETKDRTSDLGLYLFADDFLNIFPGGMGSPPKFISNTFQRVTIVKEANGGPARLYLENSLVATVGSPASATISLDQPKHLLSFFLDNDADGDTSNWRNGRIAYLRIWNRALSHQEALDLELPQQNSLTSIPVQIPTLPHLAWLSLLLGISFLSMGGLDRVKKSANFSIIKQQS